ncbi:hypothetical protein MKX01_021272 [Papaver californicum]|nr:hypothetical protein MKX01_021272 [Papaver californicum]
MIGGGGRRVRRFGRGNTPLPLLSSVNQHRQCLSHTITCWYCDYKISAFNGFLFSFGRKHSRFLRIWFSMGITFSFAALLVATLVLLWNSTSIVRLYNGNVDISNDLVFGFFSLPPLSVLKVPGLGMSLSDGGYIIFSTLISVAVHEFGHAISAASEGVHIEYIAIFLATLFPGALVAFNYEILQSLPKFAVLRIYCAGIWHNAVFCAVCALALLLLPSVLYPFYSHGENPMVLDVTSMSPLSGYLSPGDVVISVDGLKVHSPQDWMDVIVLINDQGLQGFHLYKDSANLQKADKRKGYCISSSWVQDNENAQVVDHQSTCADDLTLLSTIPCFNMSVLEGRSSEDGQGKESNACLRAKDIVHLKKCGNGWPATEMNISRCECSQDEKCMGPVLSPGLTWIQISYSRPYLAECLSPWINSSADFVSLDSGETNCGGTFVFFGDALPMANSIKLTAYRPRSTFNLGLSLPNRLERMITCTFHVSLALALLNSLPVYYLDGESILEVIFGYITVLNSRRSRQVLKICLLGGTLLLVLAMTKIFLLQIFAA